MRAWFLRVAYPAIDRKSINAAKVAPILFRKIPSAELQVDMDGGQISQIVSRCYKAESARTRGQYTGTLRRFLSDVDVGDLVGIRVNKDPVMIFGRFAEGNLQPFAGLEKENIKGRPFKALSESEQRELLQSLALPDSVKSYRGTFCNWLSGGQADQSPDNEIDIADELETQRRRYYSRREANEARQVKFIRVGADLGCGQRLSRIFSDNHYQFIPIPQHNDPEFCRFTYGDIASYRTGRVQTKGRSLMSLRKGDMLVFYAGFESEDEVPARRLVGIFAFLVVKEAFLFITAKQRATRFSDQNRDFDPFADLNNANISEAEQTWKEVSHRYDKWNQHFRLPASETTRVDVIICGDREESKLLRKVEVLEFFDPAIEQYVVGKTTAEKWGLTQGHDLRMSPVRTVDSAMADEVFDRLVRLGSAETRT